MMPTSTPTTYPSEKPPLAALALDPRDRFLLLRYRFKVVRRHHRWYVQAKSGEYLHRLVLGAGPGQQVVAVDGNALNCRRRNLRITTRSEVAARRTTAAPRSGYRGVYRNGRWWRAVAQKDGIRQHLGNFLTPEQAARTYDEKARELWGTHALTNERLGFLPRRKASSSATSPQAGTRPTPN